MTPTNGKQQSHGSRRLPWHTCIMLLITFGLFVLSGPAPEMMVFDREAIMQGELWRLFTGHWVHSDWEHLAWNLLALGLLGWMIELSLGQRKLFQALLVGMCLVDAWAWWFLPSLVYYCGLSGILNTLLIVSVIEGWFRTRNNVFLLVFIGAMAKITLELIQSSALLTHTAWPAVPQAHLAGAIAGIIFLLYQAKLKVRLKTFRYYSNEKYANKIVTMKNGFCEFVEAKTNNDNIG